MDVELKEKVREWRENLMQSKAIKDPKEKFIQQPDSCTITKPPPGILMERNRRGFGDDLAMDSQRCDAKRRCSGEGVTDHIIARPRPRPQQPGSNDKLKEKSSKDIVVIDDSESDPELRADLVLKDTQKRELVQHFDVGEKWVCFDGKDRMPERKFQHYAAVVSSDDDDERIEPEQISVKEEEELFESDSDNDGDGASKFSKRQALRKLLEPLAKDRIMDLLKEAASKDQSILSLILQRADCDPAQRKLFVHGFGWETTELQLRAVFTPFGAIEELKLFTDKVMGKLKGCAFVLYKTRSSAQEVLKQPSVQIGNHTAYIQLAAVCPAGSPAASAASAGQKKLFVKNVAPTVNVDRLREFFAMFGEIENELMELDSDNKFRGYAIFEFKSVDGLHKALEEPVKQCEGCQLECTKFIAKTKNDGSKGVGSILGAASVAPMPMQQNTGMGMGMLANPMWAATALNQAGNGSAMAGFGVNYGLNTICPNFMACYGSNTISTNVMASSGSQMALQGWPRPARYHSASACGSSSAMNVPSSSTS